MHTRKTKERDGKYEKLKDMGDRVRKSNINLARNLVPEKEEKLGQNILKDNSWDISKMKDTNPQIQESKQRFPWWCSG